MLSDNEVKLLTNIKKLVHIEVEFSDDPGPGLQHLLDCHPNVANFILLFFQVGPILGSHLLSIAENCLKLEFLRSKLFLVKRHHSYGNWYIACCLQKKECTIHLEILSPIVGLGALMML